MKFRCLHFIAFMLILSSVHAQENIEQLNFSVGKPYPVSDAERKIYFAQDGEMLAIKISPKQFVIQKFNTNSLSFIKETSYADFEKGTTFETLMNCAGRYYYFYSLFDATGGNEQIYGREIDFKKGTFIGEGRIVLTIKGKVVVNAIKQGNLNVFFPEKFQFTLSTDSSKFLISYRKKPVSRDDSKSNDVIGLCVYDNSLKELWKEEVMMPYSEKKMDILKKTVDKNANVLLVAKVFKDNSTDDKKSKQGPANYQIEVLKIAAGTKSVQKTSIDVGDKFIKYINIFEIANKIACSGYFANGKDMDAIAGVFLFKLSIDGIVEDTKFYEIPLEILKMNISKNEKAKAEKSKDKSNSLTDIDNLELSQVIVIGDGSVILIGEQVFTTSGGDSFHFHYDNMLITKINADGTLAWMKKLPKRQTGTQGQRGMSFFYDYNSKSDAHNFLFLDNEKNKTLGSDEVPAEHTDGAGGFLTSYSVDHKTGKVNKSYIFDVKMVKGIPIFQFQVDRIFANNLDEYFMEVYKKEKEDVLIKLFLKND